MLLTVSSLRCQTMADVFKVLPYGVDAETCNEVDRLLAESWHVAQVPAQRRVVALGGGSALTKVSPAGSCSVTSALCAFTPPRLPWRCSPSCAWYRPPEIALHPEVGFAEPTLTSVEVCYSIFAGGPDQGKLYGNRLTRPNGASTQMCAHPLLPVLRARTTSVDPPCVT